MASKNEIIELEPTMIELTLQGIIDETSKFPTDFDFSKYSKFYIDFSDVVMLNSGGIKQWVNFTEQFSKHDQLKVFFKNCNRMVVSQINKTVGFLPANSYVESVFLPIFCNQCKNSLHVLHNLNSVDHEDYQVFDQVEDTNCESFPYCKKKWELDYVPKDFFRFLDKK